MEASELHGNQRRPGYDSLSGPESGKQSASCSRPTKNFRRAKRTCCSLLSAIRRHHSARRRSSHSNNPPSSERHSPTCRTVQTDWGRNFRQGSSGPDSMRRSNRRNWRSLSRAVLSTVPTNSSSTTVRSWCQPVPHTPTPLRSGADNRPDQPWMLTTFHSATRYTLAHHSNLH